MQNTCMSTVQLLRVIDVAVTARCFSTCDLRRAIFLRTICTAVVVETLRVRIVRTRVVCCLPLLLHHLALRPLARSARLVSQ